MRPEDLEETLAELQIRTLPLEPTPETLGEWMQTTTKAAQEFLRELPHLAAYRSLDPVTEAADPSLNAPPSSLETVATELLNRLLRSGMNAASGKFFGYIPGGGVPLAAIGDFLAALTNRYAGVFLASPGAAKIENELIQFFIQEFGFPDSAWGALLSGGSASSLMGLLAARETRPADQWARSVIYLTTEAHASIARALRILALNQAQIRLVPTDASFRMDTAALESALATDRAQGLLPWIICAAAGTTNTGAIDPLPELVRLRDQHGLWLHLDAAYGGFFQLVSSGKERLSGIEAANSLVLDPHKGLFMPYGLGAVLVRNGDILRRSLAVEASYLADVASDSEKSSADYSLELTRHFRGARLWLCLRVLGLEPFRAALEEKLLLARWLYERLRSDPALELTGEPQLSVVAFRLKGPGDGPTQKLLQLLLTEGKVHLSSTRLGDRFYLRACVLCFRSHLEETRLLAERIQELSKQALS